MNAFFLAMGAGFVFGTGLWVSGMANPKKVLAFLDVAGDWDPSLMLVMAGALAVALPGYRWVLKRSAPLFSAKFHLPDKKDIDPSLIAGAALFGAGWGIAGYCPGPGIAAMAGLSTESFVFVGAMVAGGLLQRYVFERKG